MVKVLLDMMKKIGRIFFTLAIKNYMIFKPLLGLVNLEIRSRFKMWFLRRVFRVLYFRKPNFIFDVNLKKGITLVGYPCADIGEGELLRQTARAFLKNNINLGIYNFNFGIQSSQNNQSLASFIRSDNPHLTNIFHLKPDQFEAFVVSLGNSFVKGRYNIGFWTWELSDLPESWMVSVKYFHEIWCPSRFIQSAVSKFITEPAAVYMPPALEIEDSKGFDRSFFKLPKDRFLFIFIFDFKSCFSRKNPMGCVRAFQEAFHKMDKSVGLVLKSIGGEQYPNEFSKLNKAIQADSRITFIDAMYSSEEIIGLISVCDSFVSLHRSEGIGLSIAQSMLLGKPVIATRYSGNIDFTRPDNSCLVDYKLIEVGEGEYPFSRDQVWADPNIDQASDYMRKLVEDNEYRDAMSRAGYSYIKTYHSYETVGEKYRRRLIDLGLLNE